MRQGYVMLYVDYLYSINIGLYWIIYSTKLRTVFMLLVANTLVG